MGLKIAITSTVSWPYVRRGSRITYELAVYLAKQGHEVHYISTKPGNVSRKKSKDGVEVEYHRLIGNPLLTLCRVQKFDTFSFSCLASLLKNDYDIVQTTFPMDAFAASIYRSIKGTPFVHYMFDRFYPRYYITNYGKSVFNRCMRTTSGVATISKFISNDLKEKFGVEGVVIPGTVDIEQFTLCENKDLSSPYILSTSSLIEPRKRIALLVKAFERFLDHVPNAVLKLSGHTTPETSRVFLDSVSPRTRKAIEILGVGKREDLPGLYRNAAVTVLPSVDEAFGLVILEALASGTPVVGTRSGGITDILNDPKTGILFEQADGPEELCTALLKGLELSRDPETWKRCRHHAEQYSWGNVGPQYEKLYYDVLDGRQPKRGDRAGKKRKDNTLTEHSESRGERLKGGALSSLFDEALDELDIDYDNYYKYELYKPMCTYILGWLINNDVREGNVLVISSFPFALVMFLEKYGFTARGIGSPDIDALKDMSGSFDIIISDDILKNAGPGGRILKKIGDKLKPGGILVLGEARKRADGNGVYNAGEAEKLISDAGFSVSRSSYMIKEKAIEGSLFPTPVLSYLYKNFNYLTQKAFPFLRSHIFIAATRKSVL
jgi:glycosyltransferase involved in cell wall biosynthesis